MLCVPLNEVDTIFEKTTDKQAAEVEDMAKIKAGEWDRSWVDRTLIDRGCKMP